MLRDSLEHINHADMSESEIKFKVKLDENKVPERIDWNATDAEQESTCKAAFLSLWDEREQNTLRIDLWTKEMQVDEMKRFFHQNILTMADVFLRATNEQEMAEDMKAFGRYFGEKMLGIDPQS